jgi:aspartate ammonia-lyase
VLTLANRCVRGITADRERLRTAVERSIGLATALTPSIGYERATEVAQEALASDRGVYELVREKGWLTPAQLDEALLPQLLCAQIAPQPGPTREPASGRDDVPNATQRGVRCPTI